MFIHGHFAQVKMALWVMNKINIQVKIKNKYILKKKTPSGLGITSTDADGDSQVKHTNWQMYCTGSFSRYTLYTS